jgi:ATP-dependent DNA helicase PIF1
MVVDEGKNVFFTGAAGTWFVYIHNPPVFLTPTSFYLQGTGKSLLLRAIITALKKKHVKKPTVISVTASTGMAASNVGGTFFPPACQNSTLKASPASLTLGIDP